MLIPYLEAVADRQLSVMETLIELCHSVIPGDTEQITEIASKTWFDLVLLHAPLLVKKINDYYGSGITMMSSA
jgi:hypothetical protein